MTSLRVVWLPEGNGAALFEADDILAIIPPWSGMSGFDGYARDNIGDGPVAWELQRDNVLYQRFRHAEDYWEMWNGELWATVQKSLLDKIEATLGRHSNYYAIDGGEWPPKAIVRIPVHNHVFVLTVGMCLRPQPNVEFYTESPQHLRRIELGAVLPEHWTDPQITGFCQYLSGQSNLPWTNYTWLGAGHTLPCDSWNNGLYEYALLKSTHNSIPSLTLPAQFGDPVNMLWFIPITATERMKAMNEGSESLDLAGERP